MLRGSVKLAPALGTLILAVHVVGLACLYAHCGRAVLQVRLEVPTGIDGVVPPSLADRVRIDDSSGPGLQRRRWSVSYRGGFTRTVTAAALVGPFQDPAVPACSGRVVVGQALLDDATVGAAGAGSIAHIVERELAANLNGLSQFPIGSFEKLRGLDLTWNRAEQTPDDKGLVDAARAPHGYIRARTVVVFTRVEVPITVVMIPALTAGRLTFAVRARARLDFDNRFVQWASDLIGGDKFATRIAQDEIDELLVTVLEPPPPLPLGDGRELVFGYCGAPPEIAHHAYAAVPISVAIRGVPGADGGQVILPPRFGPATMAPVGAGVELALDLDLDALNAIGFELWRMGFVDEMLAIAGIDRRFNEDPTVAALLTLRISPLRLAQPPVITAAGDRLRMAGDLAVTIADAGVETKGRVWTSLDFRFGAGTEAALGTSVELGELDLTCEPEPGLLVPCYGDLVAALRARAPEVHDTLSLTFAQILRDIFVDQRISDPSLPGALVVDGVRARAYNAQTNAMVRLELDARIEPR
jgi:hypothetical protein